MGQFSVGSIQFSVSGKLKDASGKTSLGCLKSCDVEQIETGSLSHVSNPATTERQGGEDVLCLPACYATALTGAPGQ